MRLEVLSCSETSPCQRDGWSFPPRVKKQLLEITEGLSVLHLFGGKADWGLRLDLDWEVRPDVIGDAWVPPFKRDSFDVVILDPPYVHFNPSELNVLLRSAAWCARKKVIWFSTIWINSMGGLRYTRGWLVKVASRSVVRCIQVFETQAQKQLPICWVKEGPALKYRRWLGGQYKLL